MNLARALVQRAKAGSSKRLIVTRILLKALEAPSCFRMSTGIILYVLPAVQEMAYGTRSERSKAYNTKSFGEKIMINN